MTHAARPSRQNLRLAGWGLAAMLLLAPLLAMRFTSAVDWGAGDFLVAALLLGGAGLAMELVPRLVQGTALRLVIGLAIAAALALTWAQLAVGLV